MAEQKYQVTEQGLINYKNELEHLNTVEREQNKIALQEARALGDLSENSDYEYAKKEQGRIDERIAQLEDIIKNHVIIQEEWVKVLFVESGIEKKFQIVGVLEADPEKEKISAASPLIKALKGHHPGEEVTYTSGSGKKVTVKIIEDNI